MNRVCTTALISVIVLVAGCDRFPAASAAKHQSVTSPSDSARQMAFGVRHNLTFGGVLRARISADSASVRDEGGSITFYNAVIVFVSTIGDTLSTANASKAVYDISTHRILLSGGTSGSATVRGRDAQQLTSSRITYAAREDRLEGDTVYSFSAPGGARSGSDFQVDPGLKALRPRSLDKPKN